MTGRFASWIFAAALAVVSIGCQPAEEPQPDVTLDVDLGEAQPATPTADSNTTTTPIETPDVAETPELSLPPAEDTDADAPVVVEEPADELPTDAAESETEEETTEEN